MHVAHLDRRALARQSARTQRRKTPAVRKPGQRVRLIHELRELRGAEELLQRSDHGSDVDDRLRCDRVDVLGGHSLADDPLHAVEADPERFLDQLTRRAQPPVAEVLVLVELTADWIARQLDCVSREILRVLGHAELRGKIDEPPNEREDVLGRQDPCVLGHLHTEALVQLVPADLREVVALGVEEQ
ncbi:MAG: hypothetical protein HW413_3035 [Thermoleophilia bacterium]|nr:hypothetical protein [Thermoleophilia bacterium]